MLPAEHRLRRSTEFTEVFRRGRRASAPLLTVHVLLPIATHSGHPPVTTVGLVISKTVGGSVVRHRTARRLRHLLRDRVAALPAGTRVVVRAAPGAGRVRSGELAVDLDGALRAVARRGGRP